MLIKLSLTLFYISFSVPDLNKYQLVIGGLCGFPYPKTFFNF